MIVHAFGSFPKVRCTVGRLTLRHTELFEVCSAALAAVSQTLKHCCIRFERVGWDSCRTNSNTCGPVRDALSNQAKRLTQPLRHVQAVPDVRKPWTTALEPSCRLWPYLASRPQGRRCPLLKCPLSQSHIAMTRCHSSIGSRPGTDYFLYTGQTTSLWSH